MATRIASLTAALALLAAAPAAALAQPGKPDRGKGDERRAQRALERLERLPGNRQGREASATLRELALTAGSLDADGRRAARNVLMRPDEGAPDGPDPFDDYSVPAEVHCGTRFCVHWVESSEDAVSLTDTTPANGVPDYADDALATFEQSADVQNTQLGWPAPVGDGSLGGDTNKTDVYLMDIIKESSPNCCILGFAAPDPGQNAGADFHFRAYLVMDNDYAEITNGAEVFQATAAHEYNHVIQYGIDFLQDPWMFEATAVWMEDKTFDSLNDYGRFLAPWSQIPGIPLTAFTQDFTNPASDKPYGDVVYIQWLEERYGTDSVLDVWQRTPTSSPTHFAPGAIDAAIRARGGPGFVEDFACFAAATSEWRSSGAGGCAGRGTVFPEGPALPYPDMKRELGLSVDSTGATGILDHTTFALFDLPASGAPYKVIGRTPAGTASAVAFAGRSGDQFSGPVTTRVANMPSGGTGSVLVEAPSSFSRLTAVLVNSDTTIAGFNTVTGDWAWSRDGQSADIRVSSDVTPAGIASRSPAPGATRVPVRSKVVVKFSEPVSGVGGGNLRLLAPDGRQVPADVIYDAGSSQATLTPRAALAQGKRFTVQLSGAGIADGADNRMADDAWSFTTVNVAPLFRINGVSRQKIKDVRRRGLKVLIRSLDSERLTITLKVLAPGRKAGRSKKITLRAGARKTLRLKLSPAGARLAATRRSMRVRVQGVGVDPTRLRKTRARSFTIVR